MAFSYNELYKRYEELKERQTGLFWEPMEIDEKEKIASKYGLTKLGFIERRLKKDTEYNCLEYLVVDKPTLSFSYEGRPKDVMIKSSGNWSLSFENPPDEFEGLFE